MAKGTSKLAIPDEIITNKIYLVRDKRVMLDEDLAELYGVTTGNLNKAVSRNIARFPEDFMFQLTKEEFDNLFFQTGTSSWGGRRKPPYAFTEQGVAMLSGILHSERAITVNIQIMRVFTKVREILMDNLSIRLEIEQIKKTLLNQIEKTHLIILDDFGLHPMDGATRLALLQILEDRYGKKSVIMTSQLPVTKWHEYIGESTIADAIMDRLAVNAHRIDLKGESLRKKK